MMKKLSMFFAIALISITAQVKAQESQTKSEMLADAELYLQKENYLAALPLYEKLDSIDPNIDYKFKLGICYLYETEKNKLSIDYLEKVLKEKPKTEDLHFYLGRAYALNYQFDNAVKYYNEARSKKTSKKNLTEIDRYINYTENAKKLVANPIDVKIENIGRPVNSKYSEYVPVISADESVLIFTYRGVNSTGGLQNEYAEPDPKGRYYEDVFMSVKLGGESWAEPELIGENINTHGHDASLALSANGQKLFVYKDTEGSSGDIYESNLEGYVWSAPVSLDSNINTKYWEGGVSLSADENLLYFASERPDGIGGRDIYKSKRNSDGTWGPAENLGATINTPYNDESPFIHPDNKTLFFSSEGHNSMGGYDVFRSLAITDTSWTIPENIGYPINTSGDDRYYVVSANGARGYYSSAKNGGYGEHDIYVVHLGDQAKQHHLVLIKGEITANDKFAEAEVSVEYVKPNMPYEGYFKSNSATGKYIVILPGNNNYNLTFKVNGFEPHVENVNASNISTYKEIIRDIKLYSADYVRTLNISGKLMVGENYAKPASAVTIFIANKDATVSLQTTTDNEGNFSFDNVPSGFGYTFTLARDANISKALLTGKVSSGGNPKPGIHFSVSGGNETSSKEDGSFKLEILPGAPKECDFPVQYLLPFAGGKAVPDFSDEIYRKIINKYGGCIAEGLIFKVQIGAYFTPENFNYSYFNEFGNVTTQLLKDGITRFVMGKYKRLNEAEGLRNKAVKVGDKDAFIVIYYNGERMTTSEAIAKEF